MGGGDPAGEKLAIEQRIHALHHRLLAGDRVASEELARLVLGPLVKKLERRWPRWAHLDVLHEAAVKVFLNYIDAPERYDPSQASLMGWLELAAHRDVIHIYRSAKQRAIHDTPPLSALGIDAMSPDEPLDLFSPIGLARVGPDPDDADRLDSLSIWSRIREAFPDERERELIWACWVEGESSSERLAQILEIDHLPLERRRRKVKNARDVAMRRLRRIGLVDDEHD